MKTDYKTLIGVVATVLGQLLVLKSLSSCATCMNDVLVAFGLTTTAAGGIALKLSPGKDQK